MNFILLEGLSLYMFLILFGLICALGIVGFGMAVSKDKKREALKDELYIERERNISLNRDNMRLKLKCGELRVGEKVDV